MEEVGSSAPLEYKSPCLNWHCSIDEVRTYMKSFAGFKEDGDVESTSEGDTYTFYKGAMDYSYTFKSDGLVKCSFNKYGGTRDFDKLKSDVTSIHNVTDWKQEQTMYGLEWWTTTLKGKKTGIDIGKSESAGGYIYVTFNYTEFDW